MSESYSLPTEPEGIVTSLLERFNSGKVSAMMGLYAPEAVFIAKAPVSSALHVVGVSSHVASDVIEQDQ